MRRSAPDRVMLQLCAWCVADIEEELCDGNPVLINPRTGLEYNCNPGRDICPAGSYCHKLVNVARCCQQGLYDLE